MAILVGIILLALGLSLTVVWSAQVLQAIQGLLPLGLFFLGFVVLLVGYSERKAAREYDEAIQDGDESAPRRRRKQ